MAKTYSVLFPHRYTQNDEERTEMVRVGTAFRLREKDGFSLELSVPLALPEGARLVVLAREQQDSKPPTQNNKGNRR